MVTHQPPVAAQHPTVRTFHEDSVSDSYEWLRDKDSEEVLAHLHAENAYTEQVTADQQPLREAIFSEIKERTLETDLSVPARKGSWWYFARSVEGEQYPVMCRVAASTTDDDIADYTPPVIEPGVALAGEQVLLDCNEFARELPYFSLGGYSVSFDGALLAFSVDSSGDERYTQHFLDCSTGTLLDETIDNIFAGSFLTPDGSSLIYTVADESWRPYEVRRHLLGSTQKDQLLFHEADAGFWLGAEISSDQSSLIIEAGNSEFAEVYVVALDALDSVDAAHLTPVISRNEGVQYGVEPVTVAGSQHLLIVHNFRAVNSEVVLAPAVPMPFNQLKNAWVQVLPHQETVRVEGVALSRDRLVVAARANTTSRLFFAPVSALQELMVSGTSPKFDEPADFTEELYTCTLSAAHGDSPVVRFSYGSWVTPTRIYDYFPATAVLEMRKETPVLGGFNREDYRAYRVWAQASDGTDIPVSIMHRADLDLTREHPVLQYGYGSYEVSMDPAFSIARLSLLNRGVIFAVAHIRGGGELGRQWYLDGKKLAKKNSFTDFVAVTDYLAAQPFVDATNIVCMGGSAGGLLIGAVLNLAPEKYRAAIAQVPFVDALTSILDPELPLSALEWEEWGNPLESREVYEYMKSYSPYENIHPVRYPPIAAVTSLNDTRVLYVEPAKWVAKLRETIDPTSPVPLLKIEMDGGHGGGSGRYTRWRDAAWDYAFALTHMGL
ncbi:S9 family peptidase [Rothia sp. ZJ932]|uniref:S9 family peptidase n=1 Tax=Rothia sp. ZJ932 TaxID=2810516 RepID=UPI00196831B1|nr:S9 family peptidase [Rothia sp. ZJ932]QRZ61148.1 S9 family peptidase [Rothia sp. ZJ932]